MTGAEFFERLCSKGAFIDDSGASSRVIVREFDAAIAALTAERDSARRWAALFVGLNGRELLERAEKAEADAAAMRQAVLKHFTAEPHQWQPQTDGEGNGIGPFEWMCGHCGGSGTARESIAHENDCSYVDIIRALAPDAGRALLVERDRLREENEALKSECADRKRDMHFSDKEIEETEAQLAITKTALGRTHAALKDARELDVRHGYCAMEGTDLACKACAILRAIDAALTTPALVAVPATGDRIYPCADCGIMRSAAEGGEAFTVCDECWDKVYPKEAAPDPEQAARQAAVPVVNITMPQPEAVALFVKAAYAECARIARRYGYGANQAQSRSIAEAIESAAVRVTEAGRTDMGVDPVARIQREGSITHADLMKTWERYGALYDAVFPGVTSFLRKLADDPSNSLRDREQARELLAQVGASR